MTDRDALLQAARRADWRFLLPDPELGSVGYLGRADTELERSCSLLARSFGRVGSGGEAFDVVVAAHPSRVELSAADAALRPRGWLYAELRRLRLRGAVEALGELGFEEIAVHWHRPSFAACEEIVPLERSAVRSVLERRSARSPRKALLGRALLRAGAFRWAIPCASVVGRKPGEAPMRAREPRIRGVRATSARAGAGSLDALRTFLELRREELELGRFGLARGMTCVLVTPRFRASRHVVVLVLPAGGDRPVLVAKIPRLPGDDDGVLREEAALAAVQSARAEGFDTIPRVVAFAPERPHAILVETALHGRPVGRADVRRSRAEVVSAVEVWLGSIDPARPDAGAGPADYRRLLEEPLHRFAGAFEEGEAERHLVERTLELTAPFRTGAVPLVFEHGDLSEPNLIRLEDGRIGVVDWELAEPRGLPGHDLVFFLAYAAFAAGRAATTEQQLAAFDHAVLRPDGWARPNVLSYAARLGIAPKLVEPLVVACWARQTAALLARIGSREPTPELLHWLRSNRYYALWRLSLERGPG